MRNLPLMAAAMLATIPASATAQAVPKAPDDGGPLIFVVTARSLNVREGQTASSPIITTVKRGTVLSNLGCANTTAGQVWCDVQPLGGGPRRYALATYLQPAVSPHGAVVLGPDTSALRAGKGEFDATGPVPCSRQPTGPWQECQMGVARTGGGFATVAVTYADGFRRILYFANGMAIGADTSEADYTGPFAATRRDDAYTIKVGKERYKMADAIIFGG